MLKSLFTGVTGLNIHQVQLDVIGNNIANVNTTSYKSQQTNFSDVLYQETQSATAAEGTKGTINPKQVGLGAYTSSISTNIMAQGAAQSTDLPFDMMIQGDSFFIVNSGEGNMYTRDGSFTVDNTGALVTRSGGAHVMGWVSNDGETVDQNGQLQQLNLITEANQTAPAEATTSANVTGNIDANDNAFASAAGMNLTFGVYDNEGNLNTVKFVLHADEGLNHSYTATLASVQAADGTITPVENGQQIQFTFDAADGKLISAGGNTNGQASVTLPQEAGGQTLNIDFSLMTNYNTNGLSTIKSQAGTLDGDGAGRSTGTMRNISVGRDGSIHATYTNGTDKLLGQIAVAEFANASGLEKAGDNLYAATASSGNAKVMDVTADGGSIATGVVEASNVDLATEFTRMITAQRGFQANSKIITTSDELLQTVRSLKQ